MKIVGPDANTGKQHVPHFPADRTCAIFVTQRSPFWRSALSTTT